MHFKCNFVLDRQIKTVSTEKQFLMIKINSLSKKKVKVIPFFKAVNLIYYRPFKTKDSEVTNKSICTLLPQAICPVEV